jgi:hypothetical protein
MKSMIFKKPIKDDDKKENILYISPKINIDRTTNYNKVIAINKIKKGEIIMKEYPPINLFGEKTDDRDISLIKKFILIKETELFPRNYTDFKRTKLTKTIFDKIKNLNKFDQKFFNKYSYDLIEYYYTKHIFNSFEGFEYGPLYLPNFAKLNHSCTPNTHFFFDKETGYMNLIALKNINIDEEINISYLENKKIDNHKEYLKDHYGFVCNCK